MLNIPASEKLSFVLERRSRNHSLPKHPKVDENTHRKHQQPFSVLTVCKCFCREERDNKSTRMERVYLFWARSFPNYQNLATLPSLLSIWAFYTLMADEQIGQNRLRELAWIPNFWETDKSVSERIKQSLITDILNSVEQVKHNRFHKTATTDWDAKFRTNREKSTTNKNMPLCQICYATKREAKWISSKVCFCQLCWTNV